MVGAQIAILTRAALPHRNYRCVIIASVDSYIGVLCCLDYTTRKGAVVAVPHTLCNESTKKGIHVNAGAAVGNERKQG
ncbi:hypothetical protein F5X99DRAFT_384700 [Biscogniauxia marginata]|nr:hypothetical protein F5X99DRAFT_384700 [Biscogniauxia marginata]